MKTIKVARLKNISELIADSSAMKTGLINITLAVSVRDLITQDYTENLESAIDTLRGYGSAEITDIRFTNITFEKVSATIRKQSKIEN